MPTQYYEIVQLIITDDEGLVKVKPISIKEVEPPEKEDEAR